MINLLPGTEIELKDKGEIEGFLSSLFAAGGLVLSQVLSLTGLNMHTVQNWVKRKYLTPPVGKKYDCDQFCTIAILNLLGRTFSLENVRQLLDYTGILCPSAPTKLLILFAQVLGEIGGEGEIDRALAHRSRAVEPDDDARARLEQAAKIMLLAHFSLEIRGRAQMLFDSLDA